MLFVVTNQALCPDSFLYRIKEIARAKPERIILREKNLSDDAYFQLAEQCYDMVRVQGVELFLNRWNPGCLTTGFLHLSFSEFKTVLPRVSDKVICGTSVHSLEEAMEAEKAGAHYIIAGHIYETNCKKGLAGRGLDFLNTICSAVRIPVYAIGGMTAENACHVLDTGANGICVMSHLMQCKNPFEETKRLVRLCAIQKAKLKTF